MLRSPLEIGDLVRFTARMWNFDAGTFYYHIDGIPDGRLVMDQARLAARITAVAQP